MSTTRERLRVALRAAMKDRDRSAVAVLRTALAAIDNAEAVDLDTVDSSSSAGAVELSSVGPGSAEVPRRVVGEAEIVELVRAELDERARAAAEYETAGDVARAAELRAQVAVLAAQLAETIPASTDPL